MEAATHLSSNALVCTARKLAMLSSPKRFLRSQVQAFPVAKTHNHSHLTVTALLPDTVGRRRLLAVRFTGWSSRDFQAGQLGCT